jgi:hypothetical protein
MVIVALWFLSFCQAAVLPSCNETCPSMTIGEVLGVLFMLTIFRVSRVAIVIEIRPVRSPNRMGRRFASS